MGALEDIGTHLDTEVSDLTLGTNLFLGLLPDSPNTAAALYEIASFPPVYTMSGVGHPVIVNHRIQTYVRAADYSTCRTLAEEVWLTIQEVANETVGGNDYLRAMAAGSPEFLERDDRDRVIIVSRFDVQRLV